MQNLEKLSDIVPLAQGRFIDAIKALEVATEALADSVEKGGALAMSCALTRYRLAAKDVEKLHAEMEAAERQIDDGEAATAH